MEMNRDDWEKELLYQFSKKDKSRKRAYICSQLGAVSSDEAIENMHIARAYMYYAVKRMNLYASAPHAYLPMLLFDQVPAERAIALQFGIRLLEQSDMLLVCGSQLSEGMRSEIAYAAKLKMPIVAFDEDLYLEVQKEVNKAGQNKRLVKLDRDHYPMSFTSIIKYIENSTAF